MQRSSPKVFAFDETESMPHFLNDFDKPSNIVSHTNLTSDTLKITLLLKYNTYSLMKLR